MVINIGALKSGQDDVVESDIRGVVEASHRGGAICKVIWKPRFSRSKRRFVARLRPRGRGPIS